MSTHRDKPIQIFDSKSVLFTLDPDMIHSVNMPTTQCQFELHAIKVLSPFKFVRAFVNGKKGLRPLALDRKMVTLIEEGDAMIVHVQGDEPASSTQVAWQDARLAVHIIGEAVLGLRSDEPTA